MATVEVGDTFLSDHPAILPSVILPIPRLRLIDVCAFMSHLSARTFTAPVCTQLTQQDGADDAFSRGADGCWERSG